jgi:hypothetical protein
MTAGFDFASLYAEHPEPHLAEVNGMSPPDALAWYVRNGFNVHPAQVTRDGERRLARAGGYSFGTLAPPTGQELAWLAANWNPRWQLAMIMSQPSRLWAVDADDNKQYAGFMAEYADVIVPTAAQRTGSGKIHLLYRRPEDEASELALRQGEWSVRYNRIEVKSNGLLIVAPSRHHETGKPYQWLDKGPGLPADPGPAMIRTRASSVREIMRESALEAEREKRSVRRQADAEELALARGGRQDMSWEALTKLPKPVWIYDGLLTQGFHGLAGPPEAGKSLLVRNWLTEIAASGRNVVYALSEGQFDLADRFSAHPLNASAQPCLWFLDGGMDLASAADVAWFCDTYRAREPALVVLDMIYGFGLPDDNGMQGVAPVINGCKKIAAELGCAVLAVGHPGLNGERRFRESSMWRGSFDSEWHLGDGQFSCEKHKYADRRRMNWSYQVEWPDLRVLGDGEILGREQQRLTVIAQDFAAYQKDNDSIRARRIGAALGVGQDHARRLIRAWRSSQI